MNHSTIPWPPKADSPTQKQYTLYSAFEDKLDSKQGTCSIKIQATNATAVRFQEASEQELVFLKKHKNTLLKPESHKLLAWKEDFLQDGFLIIVRKNANAQAIIEVKSSGAVGIHSVIVLEEGAKLDLYEKQFGNASIVSSASEVFQAKNSVLNYDYTQAYGETVSFEAKTALLEENAFIKWNTALFGSQTSITKIDSVLGGENARALNYNSFFASKNQAMDVTTNSIHLVENTKGNMYSRGVLANEAKGTFRGLIRIENPAKKTESFLDGRCLLIGEKAKANNIPELEILTNDVQSTHSGAVDLIDEDQVFYLQSRGFTRKQAVKLIVEGFVNEVHQHSTLPSTDWSALLEEKTSSL